MKCFTLIWQRTDKIKRQAILDVLDGLPLAANWFAATGAIFIASENTAQDLFEAIHEKLPDLGFIIIPTDIESVWGWESDNVWNFIRDPRAP
jgi:hypothetical protein